MKYWLKIADLVICIIAYEDLFIDSTLLKFIMTDSSDEASIIINVIEYTKNDCLDRRKVGSDMLMQYYQDKEMWYCEADGKYGPVVRVSYKEDFSEVLYEINRKDYPGSVVTLSKVLQLFPMRQLLFHSGAVLLHASQVADQEGGMLFTGNSGVGKTTQAKLWEQYKGVKILCNDRTVLKKDNERWNTYGFPVDGSSPIYKNERRRLNAIVVLEQAESNTIVRLKGREAIVPVMQQFIIDVWNHEMRYKAMEYLLELLKDIPVYKLCCTPDERAVRCLSERLQKDGIWNV